MKQNITLFSKNVILIFLIISVSLILSSCATTSPSGSKPIGSSSSNRGALEISFLSGSPPDKIYVEEGSNSIPFETIINVQNKGSYPDNELKSLNGRIYLTGFDKSIINGNWKENNQFNLLMGVTPSSPEGGFMQKSYVADSINFPFKSKEYNLMLMATACYYYETVATGNICIDPNPTSASQTAKICEMGNVRLESQNAPVKITSVKQSGNSKETIFIINIANSGGGDIINQFTENQGVISDDKCMNLGFNDKNKIGIETEIIGMEKGDCTPLGTIDDPIRVYDGVAKVVCKFPMNRAKSETAYTSQINIKLSYGYMQSITRQLSLINTNKIS